MCILPHTCWKFPETTCEFIFRKLPLPEIKQKLDQVYHYFKCVDLNVELQ